MIKTEGGFSLRTFSCEPVQEAKNRNQRNF